LAAKKAESRHTLPQKSLFALSLSVKAFNGYFPRSVDYFCPKHPCRRIFVRNKTINEE